MIINLTQHAATPEQIAQGVVDLTGERQAALKKLLTFDELPEAIELTRRSIEAVEIVLTQTKGRGCEVMIGGAPFFMRPLEQALMMAGYRPVYAFSRRIVVEEAQTDGSVKKTAVFRHEGFVRPCGE